MRTSALFIVIALAASFTGLASDIYAPSVPAIAEYFGVSVNKIQWSMAIYMLGVSCSQLIYGPLSEGFGRKVPLLIGLIIMVVGSFICLFSSSANVLIWGRVIQGCGAGACAALWRSIFRDAFTGVTLAKYGSYMTLVVMLIVPAAPALGGWLQESYGWRSSFVFMLIFSTAAFIGNLISFKDTSKHHSKDRLKISFIAKTYLSLFRHPLFMKVTICVLITYGGIFSWFVSSPVLLIEKAGLSPSRYGWLIFGSALLAYGPAGWINGQIVKRFGASAMMQFGWAVMTLASVFMFVGYFLFGTTVWSIMPPAIIFYFGATFIWPNAFSLAFTPFGTIAGYVGALYGFMQILGGAVIGGIIAYLPDDTQLPLSVVMFVAPLLASLVYGKGPKEAAD